MLKYWIIRKCTKKSGLQFSENNCTVLQQLIVAAAVNIDYIAISLDQKYI